MTSVNSSQKAFIESSARHLRLLAPAGSGKTFSLVERALWLNRTSEGNTRILMLVFTTAAQQELQARVNADPRFDDLRQRIFVQTLNSWGNRRIGSSSLLPNRQLVRTKHERKTLILNTLQPVWESKEAFKKGLTGRSKARNAELVCEGFDTLQELGFHIDRTSKDEISQHMDWLASMRLTHHVERLEKSLIDKKLVTKTESIQAFIDLWMRSVRMKRSTGYYTFNDQKYLPWLELEEKVLDGQRLRSGQQFTHVFVDEVQDISALDANLVRAIREYNDASLTIAGDDDQAIFEWRAASVEFILRPEETLGVPFDTYLLEENYRSPRNIVEMSTGLIRHNERRVEKNTTPMRTETANIRFIVKNTPAQRSNTVFRYIQAVLNENPRARIALLSRRRGHLLPVQILCAEAEVSFLAAEDLDVLRTDAFEGLIDILKSKNLSTLSASDRGALGTSASSDALVSAVIYRILKYPPGAQAKSALGKFLRPMAKRTLDECLDHLSTYTGQLSSDKNGNDDGRVAAEVALVARRFFGAPTVADAMRTISSSFEGMTANYQRSDEDIFHADPPFEQLTEFSERYSDNLHGFIEALLAAREAQNESYDSTRDQDDDTLPIERNVYFMTALRAKGREFSHVVVLEAFDEFWPSPRATTPADIEAERRLFYVATTRVREELVFSLSPDVTKDSRFLEEFFGGGGKLAVVKANCTFD